MGMIERAILGLVAISLRAIPIEMPKVSIRSQKKVCRYLSLFNRHLLCDNVTRPQPSLDNGGLYEGHGMCEQHLPRGMLQQTGIMII